MSTKKVSWAAVAVLGFGTWTLHAGCTSVFDEHYVPLEGGSAGAGGSTGAGGSAGTTSMVPCPSECCAPEDCPEPDNPCQKRVCRDGGTCGTENLPDGTESLEQTEGDCLTELCDGTGNTKNQLQPIGATCTENGGQFCNATGVCVECNLDGDCMQPDKPLCKEQVCVPETCDNGMTDPPETDTDCGQLKNGGCPPCEDEKMCLDGSDCLSKVCGNDKKCKPPACNDGVQSGTETDVDCGGTCSTKCGPNKACNSDADCAGNECTGMSGTCVPNCMDGIQNNAESDADCGGGTCKACLAGQKCAGNDANCETTAYCDTRMMDVCAPKKAPGGPCSATNECMAGMCSMQDGVCCDMACDGPCVTCSAPGTEGQCTPFNANTDPGEVECPGPQLCNGMGACEDPVGAPCSTNTDCANGICVDGVCCVDSCSGPCRACNLGAPGLCVGVPKGMEDPATCAGGTNACSGGAGSTCQDAGTKKKLGASCSSNNDCFSNACRAGTCKLATGSACTDATKDNCESYRCGANYQCATCANNNDCLGTSCVIATGLCTYPAGHACTTGTQCLSGTCSNNVCT